MREGGREEGRKEGRKQRSKELSVSKDINNVGHRSRSQDSRDLGLGIQRVSTLV